MNVVLKFHESLDELENDKLRLLEVQVKDNNRFGGSAVQFAEWTGIEVDRIRQLLEILAGDGLEDKRGQIGGPAIFTITQRGRAFYAQRSLISEAAKLSEALLTPIRRSIAALLKEESDKLQHKFIDFIEDSFRRGVGIQGFTITQLATICADALDSQGTLVWQRFEQLLRNPYPKFSTGLSEQLKRELRNLLRSPYQYFVGHLHSHEAKVNEPTRSASLEEARKILEEKHQRILMRIDADIERFAREVAAHEASQEKTIASETEKTRLDNIVFWLKNRPIIAAVILLVILVTSLKGAVEALEYLYRFGLKVIPYIERAWTWVFA